MSEAVLEQMVMAYRTVEKGVGIMIYGSVHSEALEALHSVMWHLDQYEVFVRSTRM